MMECPKGGKRDLGGISLLKHDPANLAFLLQELINGPAFPGHVQRPSRGGSY